MNRALDRLEVDPWLGKSLLGRLQGIRSMRVGNYRILYTVEARQVVVRTIRHRAVAYPRER